MSAPAKALTLAALGLDDGPDPDPLPPSLILRDQHLHRDQVGVEAGVWHAADVLQIHPAPGVLRLEHGPHLAEAGLLTRSHLEGGHGCRPPHHQHGQ